VIVDPGSYAWGDSDWSGVSIEGQVIYEVHVGTFTKRGTFRAAIEHLPELVDIGVTMVELLPLADFAGRFGWGYDGVNLYAPSHLYGTPDDLRAFVDAAHRLDLAVILDVVYNHFGPDGNYLPHFAPRYFSGKPTEWGDAINFDGSDAAPVREYYATNAAYWIDEFHFDGLRLDATQQIWDDTTPHILAEICAAAREAAGDRSIVVVAENERQRSWLVRPRDDDGYGLDALWNDDFHHSARVAATGRNEAYYSGYQGRAQEFVSAAKYGFLYQGQWYGWQGMRRGTPALDLPPSCFVNFIQNHDQVANTAGGRRLHQETSPGRLRALTALLLLAPQTPMLFQGQEFAASSPFLYFADHCPGLAELVRSGRAEFLSQFPSIGSEEGSASIPEPSDAWSFVRSKLDWSERRAHRDVLELHRELLRLRREDQVLRACIGGQGRVDGATFNERSFALRYFGPSGRDRLLVVNLGDRLHADPVADPLVAPPPGGVWTPLFSTETPTYGGWGTPPIETADDGWWIPAECAALLRPTHAKTTDR
jgi:maltooligosyltrehalose trehalohydrolase